MDSILEVFQWIFFFSSAFCSVEVEDEFKPTEETLNFIFPNPMVCLEVSSAGSGEDWFFCGGRLSTGNKTAVAKPLGDLRVWLMSDLKPLLAVFQRHNRPFERHFSAPPPSAGSLLSFASFHSHCSPQRIVVCSKTNLPAADVPPLS